MPVRKTNVRRARPTRKASSRKVSRPWTRDEIAFMRKYYRGYETAWVARQLGRTVYSVRYKAVDLSIKKASPKVWKGRTGAPNSFRKASPSSNRPTPRRAAAPRRNNRSRRSYRASGRRTSGRRSAPRRRR